MPASGCTIPLWITELTDDELVDAFRQNIRTSAALSAAGMDVHTYDQLTNDLLDEHARRR